MLSGVFFGKNFSLSLVPFLLLVFCCVFFSPSVLCVSLTSLLFLSCFCDLTLKTVIPAKAAQRVTQALQSVRWARSGLHLAAYKARIQVITIKWKLLLNKTSYRAAHPPDKGAVLYFVSPSYRYKTQNRKRPKQ